MKTTNMRGLILTQGFTLIEMMIVLVIIGTLMALTLPGYRNQMTGSRRADCMAVMLGFAQAMDRHYALNYTYAGAADGGDTGTPAATLYPSRCPVEGTAHYSLTIESATASTFKLRASPLSDSPQVGDGDITIDHLGRREWDSNGDGDIAADERTWKR